ncbi:hypothetical protein [Crocosphaera chwakensis]|uniref:DUF3971 domain-containing protein n=1 Tax=Crocosphaera chwakensis CCY0110 TaxID=391612 RepID=A3IS91_9CHRO|nr:hypothetical protein [Crocosphaera chwakensis]EAZ90607.1 hypothetical protein CY0110_08031 [Crocosphaera chwakensis CCY0110]
MIRNRSPKQRENNLQCLHKRDSKRRHHSFIGWSISVVLLGLAGGTLGGGFLVQRNLTPVVEEQLRTFLNRPVELGELEGFSFNYIRFGQTELLTTPTDPANVSMSGLKIAYNPLKYIIDRKLEIEVIAIEPSAYIEQGKDGNWLLTQFNTLNPNSPIRLKNLGIQKGEAIIVSRSKDGEKETPINIENLSGIIQPINNNSEIKFQVKSNFVNSDNKGNFNIAGIFNQENRSTNLLIRGHQLNAEIISQVLPLPIELEAGKIDANLEVSLANKKLTNFQGIAKLTHVDTNVEGLPQRLKTHGQLQFKGKKINFDEVITQFGEIRGVVKGYLDLDKGFNLSAKTQVIPIRNIFKTIKQEPKTIPIIGKVQGNLKIIGSLNNPDVLIALNNKDTIKIDRVDFQNIKTHLTLNKKQIKINQFEAIPTVGGEVIGKGNINISPSSPLYSINLEGKSLPTASLGNLYKTHIPNYIKQVSTQVNLSGNLKEPESFKAIGKANFQVAEGTVKAEHITYANGNWQSNILALGINLDSFDLPLNKGILQGSFQASGNIRKPIKESLKGIGELKIKVDNGWINAQNIQLSQGNWQANLQVNNANINQLLPKTDLEGKIQGSLYIAGDLNPNLNNIQAKGQGSLTVGGGQIVANNLFLSEGKWSSEIIGKNVNVNSLTNKVPEQLAGKLNSNLTLVGNVSPETFLESIEGKGNAKLMLSQGTIAAKDLTITQGNFNTTLIPEAIPLKVIASQLTGNLSGNLEIAGKLNKISPEYLQAKGNLQFSQGLPYINRFLTQLYNGMDNA